MEFPINRELVETTTRIKEERRVVRERLQKIDDNRSTVSPTVYARVRSDYEVKLDEITAQLVAKKVDIDRELATLYAARTQVERHVAEHKEQLEELHFRHSLGEHDDTAFQDHANGIGEKLAKFEAVLSAITGNVARYESLLADEQLPSAPVAATAQPIAPEPPAVSIPAAPTIAPPLPTPPPAPERKSNAGLITAPIAVAPHDEPTDDPEHTPREVPLSAVLPADITDASGSYRVDDGDYFGGPIGETQLLDTGSTDGDTAVGPTPHAPPASHHSGVLRLLQGGTGSEIFPLVNETTIGRSTGNVVVLREAKVSRQHAIIRRIGHNWTIEDLQSSNGVIINGDKVVESALNDGDEIQIGDFVLKIELA